MLKGLIRFYQTLLLKYNIIVSEPLNQNLLSGEICLSILPDGSGGRSQRSAFLLAFE